MVFFQFWDFFADFDRFLDFFGIFFACLKNATFFRWGTSRSDLRGPEKMIISKKGFKNQVSVGSKPRQKSPAQMMFQTISSVPSVLTAEQNARNLRGLPSSTSAKFSDFRTPYPLPALL